MVYKNYCSNVKVCQTVSFEINVQKCHSCLQKKHRSVKSVQKIKRITMSQFHTTITLDA